MTATRPPQRRIRKRWIAAVAAIGSLLVGVAALITALKPATPGPTDGPPRSVTAHIGNTWDDRTGTNVGVFEYLDPQSTERAGPGLPEGTAVTVLCQYLHGRTVTDTPHNGRLTSSTVFDKLADGHVISDIYTDLPKAGAQTAPGLGECQ